MSAGLILAIDQGTTSTRAILYDGQCNEIVSRRAEVTQHYPADGRVEHDADEIWAGTLACMRGALAAAGREAREVAGIGITNQRETVVLWDRASGRPLHRAIVWQDRRTAGRCAALREAGHEPAVRAATGLLLDPYFSATKLAWLLDEVAGARAAALRGELAFGTIDCFLLWRLTGGRVHATDATNASRTLLYDIHAGDWSEAMLRLFDIPASLLPTVTDNAGALGVCDPALLGAPVPVTGMAGDQQAALVGQGCTRAGEAKATYGTGCFMLLNTGDTPARSPDRLLTTIGYRLGGRTTYALEGSIFVAGAAIKWLRDGIGIIADAADTGTMATGLADNGGVYMVPAFVGLGAPHWRPDARGLVTGLTLDSGPAHLARAALEAVAYQTNDLVSAMRAGGAARPATLRIDGGMAASDWLCRFLADILDLAVERPAVLETTARGAAFLAGIGAGLWAGPDAIRAMTGAADRFEPAMPASVRAALVAGWDRALAQALA